MHLFLSKWMQLMSFCRTNFLLTGSKAEPTNRRRRRPNRLIEPVLFIVNGAKIVKAIDAMDAACILLTVEVSFKK